MMMLDADADNGNRHEQKDETAQRDALAQLQLVIHNRTPFCVSGRLRQSQNFHPLNAAYYIKLSVGMSIGKMMFAKDFFEPCSQQSGKLTGQQSGHVRARREKFSDIMQGTEKGGDTRRPLEFSV